ncbi:autotransporter domain-containing protein [Sphingomonas bacterium]|uniref:autotransporter domain-containing protein n=1 Tax=Sphingomonas bacterium TaxID=1895847 RepID=UPI0020C62C09|nr:autotransporter domain-containing protein [Sphingomonas bacterium]
MRPATLRVCLLISSAFSGLVANGAFAQATPEGSDPSPAIVVTPPATPTSAIDPVNVTGVGQMVIDEKNGFLGLCTGTLINPRTVIFAAHCVNENPAGTGFQDPFGYGTGPGQLPISFGFAANNLPALRNWYLAGAQQYKTNTAGYLYNVNQVAYNPDSTKLGIGNNFLQGDIAVATLDTPARNVPTWTILLSQLPAPAALNTTTGTGYHVTIDGYGTNGTGLTGAAGGIDYRRRLAENYIGILGSLDDQDEFLFGAKDGLPQNLYQIDFDSPNRSNRYDFNVFKDAALPNEGTIGPGDSGGPLILDKTFSKPTVIGVLSGSDRFYAAQPANSFGTTGFYQPLYLFWDYIVANNPYHYVSAVAGDGNWTDPAHWLTNLDPAYQVISGGRLVNGVPTTPGDGINGTSGKFGAVCFQDSGVSDCQDLNTGVETVQPTTAGSGATDSQKTELAAKEAATPASATTGTGGAAAGAGLSSNLSADDGRVSGGSILAADDGSDTHGNAVSLAAVTPAPTLANGLPGATNFVPNNTNPVAATRTYGRYYDVTLSAAGTTTLNTAVAIDRLTVSGSGAKLTVAAPGALTVNMEVDQLTGLVTNNGTITTLGDYFLMGGGIQGTGRFNQPFFTSAAGMIAPGTVGTVGTITFGGNLILSSGNILMIDVGPGQAADRIVVAAGSGQPGIANIGGTVGFAPVAGATIRYNDVYSILTAEGGVTGTFATPTALSAILTPSFNYSAQAVQVRILAGQYGNVVSSASPVQRAYAQLLDGNRATNYNSLSALYGPLDLQSASTIQATLESWAPRNRTLANNIGTVVLDNMDRFYRERIANMGGSGGGMGKLTMIGRPVDLAAAASVGMSGGVLLAGDGQENAQTAATLPENVAGYLAGGYIDGHSSPMATAVPAGGHDTFNGFFIAGGLETGLTDRATLGAAFSYTRLIGRTVNAAQRVSGSLYQGAVYGKAELSGLTIDALGTAGSFDLGLTRAASLVGTNYTLTANRRALALTGELGVAKDVPAGQITIGPRVAIRGATILLPRLLETGGPMALFDDPRHVSSVEGRAGLRLASGGTIKPYLSAYYVHAFNDRPGAFTTNFSGGAGTSTLFSLGTRDHDWGEVSGGLTVRTRTFDLTAGADTTFLRKDVSNQSYRGTVTFHL